MGATGVVAAVFCVSGVFAGGHIDISVCNFSGLGETVVEQGRAEAQAIFESSGIIIQWLECGHRAGPTSFIIRLRASCKGMPRCRIDALGNVFFAEPSDGYLADAYVQAIAEVGKLYGIDTAVLLGAVMVHEVGHLLMGRGHTAEGIMCSRWSVEQMMALQHRRLTFIPEQRARIHAILAKRIGASVEVSSRNIQ
jgi:hypothetical protein